MKTRIVTNIQKLKEDVFLLSYKRDFDFIPGQVVGVTTNSKIQPRLYSIASGKDDDVISILFDVKEEGSLSPELAKLRKGSILMSSLPTGNFICKEERAWWIASGTGIAPFASMFFSGFGKGKTLIHGGRTLDSFYFQEQFSAGLGDNYVRCSSSEKADHVYDGRLTNYVQSLDNLSPDEKYYLCGRPEMVVETRDILLAKNIPYKNIMAEIYF